MKAYMVIASTPYEYDVECTVVAAGSEKEAEEFMKNKWKQMGATWESYDAELIRNVTVDNLIKEPTELL